ncbi:hypothetical protein Csa_022988 [Cucumis sativus]|nr:hypothetical protein Csa_022988 [Cucumis sativus]
MASSETDPFSSSNPTASSENNSFSTFPLPSSENDVYSNSAASSDDLRSASPVCMHKFRLYETRSKFYMVGRDKSRTYWRVLKIDRMDLSKLNIREDSAVYTENECSDLLRRIHEGNKSTGGLKFVSTCYGIVGFIKFLGPYYMLLITKRRQIGTICGHPIYGVSRSEMIPLPNAAVWSSIAIPKNENSLVLVQQDSVVETVCDELLAADFVHFRLLDSLPMPLDEFLVDFKPFVPRPRYKKLLCSVDLTKDFFFSYSYQVMRSLQKNICDNETGHALYETMFVWNEFLTRGIRNHLHNTIWTVALVYGFFKQHMIEVHGDCSIRLTGRTDNNGTLSLDGRDFKLTLIARRSRHYAGTRYLKRGVNEKGRVANDVETEQIVFEDVPEGVSMQLSSIVQNRGSIPLFWSQETSRLNLRPDIIRMTLIPLYLFLISLCIVPLTQFVFPVSKKDQNYEATRLHFENLAKRYGNPIIILNLIKTREKKPRESILRAEFANAIDFINNDLSEENRLRFLHWDLHKHARSKATNVLLLLGKVASFALTLTGFFYCQVTPALRSERFNYFLGHLYDGIVLKMLAILSHGLGGGFCWFRISGEM